MAYEYPDPVQQSSTAPEGSRRDGDSGWAREGRWRRGRSASPERDRTPSRRRVRSFSPTSSRGSANSRSTSFDSQCTTCIDALERRSLPSTPRPPSPQRAHRAPLSPPPRREKRRRSARSRSRSPMRGGEGRHVYTEPVRLWIGQLAVGTRKGDVERLFEGERIEVLEVTLFTKYAPSYGFVTVTSAEDAEHALRYLSGVRLNGSRIRLNHVGRVEGHSTDPRVVIEGLPSSFEREDLVSLAKEHVQHPTRVMCHFEGGGKGVVGSFRVEGRAQADEVASSLQKVLRVYEGMRVSWDYGEVRPPPPLPAYRPPLPPPRSGRYRDPEDPFPGEEDPRGPRYAPPAYPDFPSTSYSRSRFSSPTSYRSPSFLPSAPHRAPEPSYSYTSPPSHPQQPSAPPEPYRDRGAEYPYPSYESPSQRGPYFAPSNPRYYSSHPVRDGREGYFADMRGERDGGRYEGGRERRGFEGNGSSGGSGGYTGGVGYGRGAVGGQYEGRRRADEETSWKKDGWNSLT